MKKAIILILIIAAVFAITFVDSPTEVEPLPTEVSPERDSLRKKYHRYAKELNHPKDLIHINPENNNCLSCHKDIEPIRVASSGMMQDIYKFAASAGFPDNDCIVCHGGNPEAETFDLAHEGTIDAFEKA